MADWLRPALILGAVAALIVANVLEFRAKRRADRARMDRFGGDEDDAHAWFARRRHETLQNIEQVMHILNTVAIAVLVAILTA
jgi:Mg2+/citrate symporter